MERINHNVHLSYKDILLVPYDDAPCQIESRSDPDISIEIVPNIKLSIPIVSSPMDTITGIDMATAIGQAGGLGIYTRHIGNEKEEEFQCAAIKCIREKLGPDYPIACAIGVKCDVVKRVKLLCENGANIICLDIANGNHVFMIEAIKAIKDNVSISVIAGNVATPKAALRLANAGADAVKIGIGPGAICTTRRVTGFGVPQLTAVMNCAAVLREQGVKVIADGGIRYSGDAVKALWAGADAIMLGYALAGHDECPLVSNPDNKQIGIPCRKLYRGMSSRNVSSRYDVAAEGVCFEVQEKGKVIDTITEYSAAIRSACSYANAINLDELRHNVRAIRVSTVSQEESDPIKSE